MQKLIQMQDAGEAGQQPSLENESFLPSGSLQHSKRKQTGTMLMMTASIFMIALVFLVTLHLTFQLSRVSQQLEAAQQGGSEGLGPVLTSGDGSYSRLDQFPLLVRNRTTSRF